MKKQRATYEFDDVLNRFSVSLRNHSRRVAICSALIAEQVSGQRIFFDIPTDTPLSVISHLGGTCHDIGKLMIPAIGIKGGEYRKHPALGAMFLERHKAELFGDEALAEVVLDVVRYHHERIDGAGFPAGLKGYEIPMIVGICSVADELDNTLYLGNVRCETEEEVFKKLKSRAGKQYHECIWACAEHAWPCLIEKYHSWIEP